ncbi:hypothetical protein ACO0K7_10145 [Undibacterium sp. Ji67W]|uniref:hypothetical protein n=1 Tax=Undibacterium sp. Ji67W TaxID=3413042 RepID=UPI003BF3B488
MRKILLLVLTLTFSFAFGGEDKKLDSDIAHKQDAIIGTEQSPFVIRVAAPPIDDEKIIAEKKEHDEKVKSDKIITCSQVILAIIGILQLVVFGLQSYFLKETVKVTQQQGRSMMHAERAYIFVEVNLKEDLRSSSSGIYNEIQVKFWNHGKSPAELVQVRAYSTFASQNPPDDLYQLEGSDRKLPSGHGIPQNHCFELPVSVNISDKDKGEIENLEKTLYLVGLVKYRDIFNIEHESGFCWQYQNHNQQYRFIITPDSKLNLRT